MIYFNCDYHEGAHEKVMDKLMQTNREQTIGYGEDAYCTAAKNCIRSLCQCEEADVHFLVGGTQANLTVIAAALRPHQGVLCAESGHINVHETGAIEGCGHKVLALPSEDGKITVEQIKEAYLAHYEEDGPEHTVQPKMVYISNPTEYGTIYNRAELEAISTFCREHDLFFFLDGARLGYALTAEGNDVDFPTLARLCDVFYIGGTKVGALFGEALVMTHPSIKADFRYLIKQKGGMLAKGRLLGLQFLALLEDGLYEELGQHANRLAAQIRAVLKERGVRFHAENPSNQIFVILPKRTLEALCEKYSFSDQGKVDEEHRLVRICTSWATRQEDVDALVEDLKHVVM
jgi:threonine aldolase